MAEDDSSVEMKMLKILENKLRKVCQSSDLFCEVFILHIFGRYVDTGITLIMGLDIERTGLGPGLAVIGG